MKMDKPPSQETERNLNSEEYAMRLAGRPCDPISSDSGATSTACIVFRTTFNSRARGRGGKNETATGFGFCFGKLSWNSVFPACYYASATNLHNQRDVNGSERRRHCWRDCRSAAAGHGPSKRQPAERTGRKVFSCRNGGTLSRKHSTSIVQERGAGIRPRGRRSKNLGRETCT